jgi:hypothetical protein
MKNRRAERLSDNIAVRTTSSQRAFLERQSEKKGLPIGETVRLLIDEAMTRTGVEA